MSVNDESKTGDGQRPPMPIMSVVAKLHGSGVEVAAPGATVRKFDLLQYGVAICDGPAESRLIVLSRRSLKNFFQSASSGWMTWLHRLGAMALWIVFFAPLVSSAGPIGVALEHYIGPGAGVWEYPTLGMIAIVLLVVSSLLGLRRGGLAALYVVSFPFVAATLLILAAVGAINFIRLGYRLLGSFMMTGANSLLIFIGCLSIDRAQRPDVIAVLGLALFLAASYVVLSNFHWVTTPFQSIVDFAAWVKDWAIGEVTKASSKAVALRDSADIKNRDKQKQEIVKCAETIAMHGRYAAAFSERAGALRGGRVLLWLSWTSCGWQGGMKA